MKKTKAKKKSLSVAKKKDFSTQTKKIALKRANGRCMNCASEAKKLQFDYHDNDHSNSSVPNCWAVCTKCYTNRKKVTKKDFLSKIIH